jgi:predicted nucleic acid-binding protein
MSTALGFDSDPADELIAASSMVHGARLVTRDWRGSRASYSYSSSE